MHHAAVKLLLLSVGVFVLPSCVRVLQDEVGVKRKLGRVEDDVLYPGPNRYNPFNTKVFRVPTRTVNLEIGVGLPSKEGLTVSSEISILYRIDPKLAPKVLRDTGSQYEESLILPVFRSASADVCARYLAKDMHSAQRATIEGEIQKAMMEVVADRGFVIESVLMKSIVLPPGLAKAIENKLEAEQESQRMEFVLQRQRQEADRRVIEAEGQRKAAVVAAEGRREATVIRAAGQAEAVQIEAEGTKKANDTLRGGLDPKIMRYLGIEAFRELARSNNAKVVVADDGGLLLNVE